MNIGVSLEYDKFIGSIAFANFDITQGLLQKIVQNKVAINSKKAFQGLALYNNQQFSF